MRLSTESAGVAGLMSAMLNVLPAEALVRVTASAERICSDFRATVSPMAPEIVTSDAALVPAERVTVSWPAFEPSIVLLKVIAPAPLPVSI